MNLELFFEPICEEVFPNFGTVSNFTSNVRLNSIRNSNWKEADIVIFSLDQEQDELQVSSSSTIRKYLYGLSALSKDCKIVDLGHLIEAESFIDTCDRISQVIEILRQHHILPFFICESQEYLLSVYKGFQELKELIKVVHFDSKIDIEPIGKENSQIFELLNFSDNYLKDFVVMGYHRHLVNPKYLETFLKMGFTAKSVGEIRSDITDIEPELRDSNLVTVDLDAIRLADYKANTIKNPFGFTGEEICQAMWYAGQSTDVQMTSLFNYKHINDQDSSSAFLVATMIWYFCEGYACKKQEFSFETDEYYKYIAVLDKTDTVNFYKSKHSERWWMEVEIVGNVNSLLSQKKIIPCSYKDYKVASEGNLPERWLNAQQKLS